MSIVFLQITFVKADAWVTDPQMEITIESPK